MSEDVERMKRRLEFLKKELATKEAEWETAKGALKAQGKMMLFGIHPSANPMITAQQTSHRREDLATEVRKLKFEIEDLEAELKKKEEKQVVSHESISVSVKECLKCRKEVPKGDFRFCPFCGASLKHKSEN